MSARDIAALAVIVALLLPYAAWVSFATLLNAALWRLNWPGRGRRLEQNAIVYIEKGKAPELVVLV